MMASEGHAPGTLLGNKFRVIRLLGSGGMGAVYEIEHALTKHRRALKLLHEDVARQPSIVERFLREASAAGHIGNPHIVETFDAGTLPDGAPYLVMELLDGRSLADEMEGARLDLVELAELIRQACDGVHAAHEAGIVHRDLKPDNLFVARRDGRPFVKILDFGISKFDSGKTGNHGVTQDGSILGTPYYMSPEQVRGAHDLDARADVYALGVILYEGLAGRRPFDADTLPQLAVMIAEGRPVSLSELRPDLPTTIVDIVERAMACDADRRYRTARELEVTLRAIDPPLWVVRGDSVPAGRPSHPSTPPYSDGRTLVLPESAPPPRPSASSIPMRGSRPASLESAALGRTLGQGPSKRSALYATLAVLLCVGALVFAAAQLVGVSNPAPEPVVASLVPTPAVAAPPSAAPSVAADLADAALGPLDASSAPPVASPRGSKASPASTSAPQPGASASKSKQHGLAQDNPY